MAGQMRTAVVFRATVEAGGLQLAPGRQAAGRMPGRCPPRIVEAMMQRPRVAGRIGCLVLLLLLLLLEPTARPATAAPSAVAAIPPAFKAHRDPRIRVTARQAQ